MRERATPKQVESIAAHNPRFTTTPCPSCGSSWQVETLTDPSRGLGAPEKPRVFLYCNICGEDCEI